MMINGNSQREFSNRSKAGFDCCVGAVDGILIWVLQPSPSCCRESRCDAQNFLCGRKHKYCLNCQAVADCRGKFLDMSVRYPASTSDCIAFESSALYGRLTNGLLAEGLCLFGDNAYLNAPFLATPYPNVSSGHMDAYNYFHSQLRIRVECAFGMFVQRWGILRSAIPKGISIRKTTAMVLALAKLHNFCIDQVDLEETNILSMTATILFVLCMSTISSQCCILRRFGNNVFKTLHKASHICRKS
ncbi:DDE superfamily endonuclease [Nitzschia inconspicua]|uniref:DDE superfamily endonuclease n=1 Tax=Nitzschia inconspicua TaxID=303405 RepID=A0A9K3PCN6_9STRA|nr:DDE superfamily endonuclease [Nitzschia inconspicua]